MAVAPGHEPRFAGQVALVTGAAKGIGAAVARRLANEGACVALFDLDATDLNAVASALEAQGGRVLAIVGDVRDARHARNAIDEACRAFGGLDLLANVAGVVRFGAIPDTSEADWQAVIDTNLGGTFLFSRHAVPRFRARGGGAIVNVASVMGFAGQPGMAAYSTSKGAVVALTFAMALDHAAERIRVNCVAPGSVRTPLLRAALEEAGEGDVDALLEEVGRNHPLGRLIEPDEVAAAVLFLLSKDASAITGSCHRVDGGLLSKLPL